MTYPLIGNYGRLLDDDQSARPWLRGLVVAHATAAVLDDARQLATMLRGAGIPAIAGVDTRSLARHLRSNGCLRGVITEPGVSDHAAAVALARAVPRWEDQDFVAQVSPAAVREVGDEPGTPLVAIVDYGLKANIVNSLRRRGVRVRVLPHTATAAEVLAADVHGVVFSPGPGDPARLDGPVALARTVIDDGRPLLGICLGHQIVGAGRRGRDDPPPLRAPRRQPSGPGPGHGLRPGDGAEPRGPGRRGVAAAVVGLPGQPAQPQRPLGRGPAARATGRSRPSSTTPRAPRGRSTRSPCSTGSSRPAGRARDGAAGDRRPGDGARPTASPEARVGPDPRQRARRHRAGGRVRLRGDPGVPRAARRGRAHDPRQLQPGHDHDRPHGRGRRLPRAAHGRRHRGGDRPREARGAAGGPRRPDGAEPRDGARGGRRARAPRRPAARDAARGHPHGGGPGGVPRPARPHRPAVRPLVHRGGPGRERPPRLGRGGARRDRPARDHPAGVHARRHRRRDRRHRGGVLGAGPGGTPGEPDQAGHDRTLPRGLAGDRVRGHARRRGHVHRRVLDGERRPAGRPHGRLDRGGAGPDADRPGPPAAAQRGARDHPRARRRGRLQRPVRALARLDRVRGDRGQPARVALVRAGVEGDGLPDRARRGPDRRGRARSPTSPTSSRARPSRRSSRPSTTSSSSCRASRSTSSRPPTGTSGRR